MSLAAGGNRLFNVIMRLFGLLLAVAVFSMSLEVIGDVARATWSAETFAVGLLGSVSALIARALLTSPAYRRDLGDPPPYRGDAESRARRWRERSWWTGDPK